MIEKFLFCKNTSSLLTSKFLNQSLRFLTTTTVLTSSNEKLYELRKYTVKPDALKTYKQLTTDWFHLRTAHSKLVGFWFTEIGSKLFQTVHIWEYDSLAHRAGVRAALDKDPEWREKYLIPAMSCLSSLENSSMCLPSWLDKVESSSKKNGVFELITYTMKMGGPAVWDRKLKSSIDAHVRLGYASLVGVWYSDLGNHNNVQVLWRYDSFEQRSEGRTKAHNDAVVVNKVRDNLENVYHQESVLMLPAPWSPLH